jgi:aspartyl-tRNA(Asn)/glutamyl-tRNA(Gln) amidotransferase subunit B
MKTNYTPTIGLEIHAELKTRTKMFCRSVNDPHASEPNAHVCPVCMAFPGTLPVINKEAVRQVLCVGVAINGTLAHYTEFDRKNYFYPDIPKGYQISQYKHPLVAGGVLADVHITRVHLEEDTARSQHASGDFSLIDFNRAGVPLMELVTEPAIHDAEKAIRFAKELQLLLRTLGVSDANMEKGEMRVEANISVSPDETFGRKVEVKNLNSFRVVGKAIEYEITRQIEVLEQGGTVVQETRGWDEHTGKTFSQRTKEDAQDYRYFPEPDLPKLNISRIAEFSRENIEKSIPELPWEKRHRLHSVGVNIDDAEVLISDAIYGNFFDHEILQYLAEKEDIKIATNYLLSDIRGANPTSEALAHLGSGVFSKIVGMIKSGLLSSRGAKDLIARILEKGGDPEKIAKEQGLIQIDDINAITAVVKEICVENPDVVSDIKNGKESGIQFLIGQGMKKSKGSFNPQQLNESIRKEIGLL